MCNFLTGNCWVKGTELLQNYPNPFNPETWIPFRLGEDAHVEINIYSSLGDLIRTLDLGYRRKGSYRRKSVAAYWDGQNDFGERVSSGIYFYQMQAGKSTAMKKLVVRK